MAEEQSPAGGVGGGEEVVGERGTSGVGWLGSVLFR